jgi:isopenicillin N synthase-like dioxygenase
VPVIDVSSLLGADAAARMATAREIGRACEEIGFFVVVNHGVPRPVIEACWGQTEAFFDLPLEQKRTFAPEDAAEDPYGYVSLGGETLSAGKRAEKDGALEAASAKSAGDMKEMFNLGPKDPAAGMAPRRLPTQPGGFAAAWEAYYEEVNRLARRLLGALALSLDLPEAWFEDKLGRHCSALRAIN